MARSAECKCERNFTCGYCLRNAKPWFFTLSDGSAIYVPSPPRRYPIADSRNESHDAL